MSVGKDVIANVNNIPIDYVKCENCYYNDGTVVGDVIKCSFWKNIDFSISKNHFCSFWTDINSQKKHSI